MTVSVEIPDDLAEAIAGSGEEPARGVLEAIALEGYRRDRLSEYQVQRLLGFGTRMEVHGFLKEHGVYLHYGLEDLKHDMQEADRYFAMTHSAQSTELRPE